MIKIIDGRGTGKSSRLMLMAKELGLPIACMAPTRLQEKARAYGSNAFFGTYAAAFSIF